MLIVIPMRALRAAPPCTAAGASALDRGVAHGDAFFDGRPEWSGGPDFLGPIHAAKWADFYKCLAHQRLALPMVAPAGLFFSSTISTLLTIDKALALGFQRV